MNDKKQNNMKPAVIEQMIMWMVIFIGFVWMFFFVIDYAKVIRIQDNMDDLSKFGARYVSRINDQTTIGNDNNLITSLNDISGNMIAPLSTANINCNIANSAPEDTNSQSIFIVQGTYNKSFLKDQGANNLQSRTVVYNNANVEQIICTLSITIN